MESKGLTVNYTLFDAEAELMRRMKQSKEARFPRLRQALWDLSEKHLERPIQLASDYVLARVYKNVCIIMDLEKLLGNRPIENEFYHFKEMFDQRARKEDTRKEFFETVRQIFTLKDAIMGSEQHPDFFEQSGFKYSDKTFDDLFVKKFKDVINISTESSDEDIQAPAIEEEQEQIDSSAK
jgi:hypothetical protein